MRRHRLISGILATILLYAVCVAAELNYKVTILDAPDIDQSCSYGINDLGQVVGELRKYEGDGYIHAFVWENGVMTDIGVLGVGSDGYEMSSAQSINNLGQVVGYSTYNLIDPYIETPTHAFLWEDGEMYDIGSLGGDSYAYGINKHGQIVGMSEDLSNMHGFIYQNGNMQDIGSLEGRATYAYAINDLEQVVGKSYTSNSYNAFLLTNGVMTNLGFIDRFGSDALDINNKGQIVGSVTFRRQGGGIVSQAILWEHGNMINLGYLEYPESIAEAINDLGQIVGSSRVIRPYSSHFNACFWQNGEIYALNQFFPRGAIANASALDINNRGQIVGCVEIMGEDHAFVMNPIERHHIDIKPGGCPNVLNIKSKGVLPVAILGTEEFDVNKIDASSVRLNDAIPIRHNYEDVATPVSSSSIQQNIIDEFHIFNAPNNILLEKPNIDTTTVEVADTTGLILYIKNDDYRIVHVGNRIELNINPFGSGGILDDQELLIDYTFLIENECNCTTEGADGFTDLMLKFKTHDIVDALGDVNDEDVLELSITGILKDGTPIEGSDCIIIHSRGKPTNRAGTNKKK
jgi:probable HAF family extracellular repeat protein